MTLNDRGHSALFGGWNPNPWDLNEHELSRQLNLYNCIIHRVEGVRRSGYAVEGDGVKLFLPMLWLYDAPDSETLTVAILNGIKASRDHRVALGY